MAIAIGPKGFNGRFATDMHDTFLTIRGSRPD